MIYTVIRRGNDNKSIQRSQPGKQDIYDQMIYVFIIVLHNRNNVCFIINTKKGTKSGLFVKNNMILVGFQYTYSKLKYT